MKSIIVNKDEIVEELKKFSLTENDFLYTLKSGALVYEFGDKKAIVSARVLKEGGKGYLFEETNLFEKMIQEESLPQILNGNEDIFEKNRQILEDSILFMKNIHAKYEHMFSVDETQIDSIANEMVKNIVKNIKAIEEGKFLEQIMLLGEIIRIHNGYVWSNKKFYGEYTHYFIPTLRNKVTGKEVLISSILIFFYESPTKNWQALKRQINLSLSSYFTWGHN